MVVSASSDGVSTVSTRLRLHGHRSGPLNINVRLNKEEGGKLGLQINILMNSGLLKIAEVCQGGLAQAWNVEHGDQEQIRRGDWLISVNGVSEPPGAVFSQLSRNGELDLVISRQKPSLPPSASSSPESLRGAGAWQEAPDAVCRFPVIVESSEDGRLGVEVNVTSKAITVMGIREGAILEWNKENPDREVRIGDRIVFVGGAPQDEHISSLWRPGEKRIVFARGGGRRWLGGAAASAAASEVLGERAFEKLPVVSIDERCAGSDVCGICLEDWETGMTAVRLPCAHTFHKDCASQWLVGRSALCPLCQWAADCPRSGASLSRPCCGGGKEEDEEGEGEIDDESPVHIQQMPQSWIGRAILRSV
mmetsp:Transcript_39203/g.111059  ORF Transcript_39203/g.111059 Transcript_39203/m.111059 type:complete len:364 (-) Transcript_39203:133-1224(-)